MWVWPMASHMRILEPTLCGRLVPDSGNEFGRWSLSEKIE
jgi:hypothetical protein